MSKPETCILRIPTDLKQRLEREAEREGLSLNQWALYNLSQSVAFTEAYRELRSRLSRIDMLKAKETVWRLLTRPTPGEPRPAWDATPRGWKEYEPELRLGIPPKQPAARKAGRPKTRRAPR
jgi:hypothetical protein